MFCFWELRQGSKMPLLDSIGVALPTVCLHWLVNLSHVTLMLCLRPFLRQSSSRSWGQNKDQVWQEVQINVRFTSCFFSPEPSQRYCWSFLWIRNMCHCLVYYFVSLPLKSIFSFLLWLNHFIFFSDCCCSSWAKNPGTSHHCWHRYCQHTFYLLLSNTKVHREKHCF